MNSPLARYDVARAALAEARRVDEVMLVRDHAERLKLYARQAQDCDLLADANEIHMRANRKLGALLIEAKEAGQLAEGRPKAQDKNGAQGEPFSRITLKDAGISKKLSAKTQKMATLSELAFEAMVTGMRQRIAADGAVVINPMRDVKNADKKQKRAERERELANKQRALPDKKYGVILADPEWKFEVWNDDTGMDRAADNHYPTSDIDTIKARAVASIAADDCVLFLWVTVPHLYVAMQVIDAWGFDYKSHMTWVKERKGAQRGTGYWFTNEHELLLVATKGKVPCPAPGTQFKSVIASPVEAHSQKPDWQYELVESYFPNLPKIELNARRLREGWDAWGYDAPEVEAAE